MDPSPAQLPWTALLGLLVLLFLLQRRRTTPKGRLPPKIGGNFLQNVNKLTATEGTSPLEYPHQLSANCVEGKTSYGCVYRLSMPMPSEYIVTTDYKLSRMVMEGDSSIDLPEAEKADITRKFDYVDRPSILSHLTGSQERYRIRKHIAVSFSLKNLKYTQQIIYKALDILGVILERHEAESNPIDISTAILNLSFDIITESSFNVNFNTQIHHEEARNNSASSLNEGLQFFHDNILFTKECMKNTLNPFRKFMFWLPESQEAELCRRNIIKFATKIMNSYQKPSGGEDDLSIMGRIMSCEYPDERSRIQDILVFLVGGHETSSHTISYLLLALIRHPHVLKKLQGELDRAISKESKHNPDFFPSVNVLLSLPYLDMCIKESLRLWPVAGAGPKRILVQDVEYCGMTLPKGSIFHAHFYSMFRQPWVTQPDEFIPERWQESNPQYQDLKSMLMPFNVGTRQCIGQNLAKMEMAMVAAYLMRFFDFELISEPSTDVFLTVKASNILLKVKSRD